MLPQKISRYLNQFVAIDENAVVDFIHHGRPRTYEKGEIFLREGDACTELMFVDEGCFRYFVTNEGDEFTKDFCVDDSNPLCTGFASFVTGAPSLINIDALEKSSVLVWQRDYVVELFATMPWIAFSRRIAEMLFVRKEKREISLLKDSAEARYLLFVADFKNVMQRVQQYHVASYLGITPESLSRIRRRIAKR